MINLWNTRYFLLFKIVFKIDHNAFGLIVGSLIYSRFEYNTVLLIFQLWQLGASVCFEIFKMTVYGMFIILKITLLAKILFLY